MAQYQNNTGEDLIFPSLFDDNGNVLVATAGSTFTAPDGLVLDGISVVTTKAKATPAPDTTDTTTGN